MAKLNKVYANILITIGILKLIMLIIFGISQFISLYPALLNIIKQIISILEPLTLSISIIMILLNIGTKPNIIPNIIFSYLAPIADYYIPQSTMTLIVKIILPSYIYVQSGKSIKKKNKQIIKEQHLNKKIKIIIATYLIILALLTIFKTATSTITYFTRDIEKINSLRNIKEPIQINYEEIKTKITTIKGINIDAIASYEITGRVTNTHRYSGLDNFNKISPIDVSISWGNIANKEVHKKVKYYSIGDRKVYTSYPNDIDINDNEISNNHLIPSTKKIARELEQITIGDYIKIEGELVNANTNNWSVSTSIYRDDDGEGACEIIYVTKLTWLKEK